MRALLLATLVLSAMANRMPVPLIIRPAVLVGVAASQFTGLQGQPTPMQHFILRRDQVFRRASSQDGSAFGQQSAPLRSSQMQPSQQFSNQQASFPRTQPSLVFSNHQTSSLQAQNSRQQQFNNQQPSPPQTQPSQLFNNQQAGSPQPAPQNFNNQLAGSPLRQPSPQINSQQPSSSQVQSSRQQFNNQPAGSPQPAPQNFNNQLAGSPLRQPSPQINSQQPSSSQVQPSRQQFNNQQTGTPQKQPVPQHQPQPTGQHQVNNATLQHQASLSQQFAADARPARRHPLCGVMPNPGECRAAFPRYYFNTRTNQCDCFLYGGCGDEGLDSSYMTLHECTATCFPANTLEGPNCKEVFQDDGIFFEPAASLPSLPVPSITSGTARRNQTAPPVQASSASGTVRPQAEARPSGVASNQNSTGRIPTTRHPLCGKIPSPGECRGAFPRYYYNETLHQCDCFIYGGCGEEGLDSSYATLEECHKTCLPENSLEGPACKEVFQDDQKDFEPFASQPRPVPGQSSNVDISTISDEDFLNLFGR
ncbi:papilin-like isoform X2 [Penaeus japonicus]|uniref:papilin-like isoform X2 n=1 Tax=Penaeus japonicus TaxID=27405 RepID=UPI001C71448E|nr:papilin-like isoform X2 [Penaeus japonicus]